MPDEIRVSQAPVQILVGQPNPHLQVSQAPAQVLVSEANPEVRVSQAPAQVLVSEPNPEVRISQAAVQILAKQTVIPNWVFPININYGSDYKAATEVILDGAIFEAANDQMTLTATPSADTGNGYLFSTWFKLPLWSASFAFISHDDELGFTNPFIDVSYTSGHFNMLFNNALGGMGISTNSTTAGMGLDDGNWHHFMSSGDLTVGGTAVGTLWIDGTKVTESIDSYPGGAPPYNFSTGADYWYLMNYLTGGNDSACVDELYFAAEYLDLDVLANREKFIDGVAGNPVYLGETGELPTTNQPLIYLNKAGDLFKQNNGTLADFSSINTLVLCSL